MALPRNPCAQPAPTVLPFSSIRHLHVRDVTDDSSLHLPRTSTLHSPGTNARSVDISGPSLAVGSLIPHRLPRPYSRRGRDDPPARSFERIRVRGGLGASRAATARRLHATPSGNPQR